MRTRIGSDQARVWVRSLRLGNPYAKAILMAVANYVNEDGTAYPGIATLHVDTEIAENTITARLRWCESIGAIALAKCWVDENGRRNQDGRGRPTSQEIRFLLGADVEAVAESARQHTSERTLRGAVKQNSEVADPPSDEDLPPQISPCPDGGLNSVSPSVAPQQPLTGAARILESEKEERKTHSQTLSREEAGKGFSSEVDEEFEKDFERLKVDYPQGILDIEAARTELLKVSAADRKDCVRSLPIYADRLRGRGKGLAKMTERSMKAHIFIRKRCWVGLLASAKATAPSSHPVNSEEGRALMTLARIMRHTPLILNGNVIYAGEITPRIRALANAPPHREWIYGVRGKGNYAAWRDLAWSVWPGKGFTLDSIDIPWDWPPRKDGSIITSGTAPPGELSDADARELMGT